MIKQSLGNELLHVFHYIFNGHLVVDTCRLEKVQLLCAAEDRIYIVDTSAQVLEAACEINRNTQSIRRSGKK